MSAFDLQYYELLNSAKNLPTLHPHDLISVRINLVCYTPTHLIRMEGSIQLQELQLQITNI